MGEPGRPHLRWQVASGPHTGQAVPDDAHRYSNPPGRLKIRTPIPADVNRPPQDALKQSRGPDTTIARQPSRVYVATTLRPASAPQSHSSTAYDRKCRVK